MAATTALAVIGPRIAKAGWHPGELRPSIGLIVTNIRRRAENRG